MFQWTKGPLQDESISLKISALCTSKRQCKQTAERIDRKVYLCSLQCQAGSHLSFQKQSWECFFHIRWMSLQKLNQSWRLNKIRQTRSDWLLDNWNNAEDYAFLRDLFSFWAFWFRWYTHVVLSLMQHSVRVEETLETSAERRKMNVGNAGSLKRCKKYQTFLWSGSAAILLQTFWGSEKTPSCSGKLDDIVPCIRARRICRINLPAPQTSKVS